MYFMLDMQDLRTAYTYGSITVEGASQQPRCEARLLSPQVSPAQPSPASPGHATQRVVVKFWRELSVGCDMSWHTCCWGHLRQYLAHA